MSDQRGFTLVELLVSMLLGLLVLGTAFSLITASGHATKKISDRVDSAQRGRTALELITQQLRTTVCVPTGTPTVYLKPFVAATANSVTWYANLDGDARSDGNADNDPTFDPQQRRLTYDPAARTLIEERWTLPVPVSPATAAPDKRRILLTDVDPMPGTPVFGYFGYQTKTATSTQPFSPASTQADLARIIAVRVSFLARPTNPSADKATSAVMQSSVYARTVNRTTDPPANPYPTYSCTS